VSSELDRWTAALEQARLGAGQPTPVRTVRWEKGADSCGYSPRYDTVYIGTIFATRHQPGSLPARSVLLHELGHRHLGHQHRAVALQAAVLPAVTSMVVAGSAFASMLADGTGLLLTIGLPTVLLGGLLILSVLLGQLRVRSTHREYEHTADDYATDVMGSSALAVLDTYTTLSGFSRWASTHPDPADCITRQRTRFGAAHLPSSSTNTA
jgi:predicted Zn-dependent protease